MSAAPPVAATQLFSLFSLVSAAVFMFSANYREADGKRKKKSIFIMTKNARSAHFNKEQTNAIHV
jgi:hypothetical protein